MSEKIIIIGSGLAGLTSAYLLQKTGQNPLVLESSGRSGGRIYTKGGRGRSYELGATWVFQDVRLKALIQELGLELYPQYLEGDALIKYDPSMNVQRNPTSALMNGAIYHKVVGGTGAIIQTLVDTIGKERVMLNTSVKKLNFESNNVQIETEDGTMYTAEKVILTVPPKVVANQIDIVPNPEFIPIMQDTHTWMGESLKFTVQLDQDFWRSRNLSGFVFSNYGLIREMQDHSSPDGKQFGLVGFLNQIHGTTADQRRKMVIAELSELLGIKESDVLGYEDFAWYEQFADRSGNYNTDLMPHQNNGHPIYLKTHFNKRLIFAGAETSPTNPGYMEGAIESAHRAVQMLTHD